MTDGLLINDRITVSVEPSIQRHCDCVLVLRDGPHNEVHVMCDNEIHTADDDHHATLDPAGVRAELYW